MMGFDILIYVLLNCRGDILSPVGGRMPPLHQFNVYAAERNAAVEGQRRRVFRLHGAAVIDVYRAQRAAYIVNDLPMPGDIQINPAKAALDIDFRAVWADLRLVKVNIQPAETAIQGGRFKAIGVQVPAGAPEAHIDHRVIVGASVPGGRLGAGFIVPAVEHTDIYPIVSLVIPFRKQDAQANRRQHARDYQCPYRYYRQLERLLKHNIQHRERNRQRGYGQMC